MDTIETADHDEVRRWLERHGARPMVASGTTGADGADGVGVLKIEFGDAHDESLVPLDWDEFFRRFDAAGLALVHDPDPARAVATARFVGRHTPPGVTGDVAR